MVLPGSADIQRTIIVNDEATETTGQLEPGSFAVDGNGRVITTAISGSAIPTTQFTPALGSLYIDTNNDKVYTLIGGTSGSPQWKQTDANWALDDLTLDGNRIHNLDGNSLAIRTDGTNRIYDIDPSTYNISIGDLDADANETTLAVNDANGEIVLSGSNGPVLTVTTSADSVTINEEYTFPKTDGISGQFIFTDGNGITKFRYPRPVEHHEHANDEFDTTSTTDAIIPNTDLIAVSGGNYHAVFTCHMSHSSGADRITEFTIYVDGTAITSSLVPIFTSDIDDFHPVVLIIKLFNVTPGALVNVRMNTENNTATVYGRHFSLLEVI